MLVSKYLVLLVGTVSTSAHPLSDLGKRQCIISLGYFYCKSKIVVLPGSDEVAESVPVVIVAQNATTTPEAVVVDVAPVVTTSPESINIIVEVNGTSVDG